MLAEVVCVQNLVKIFGLWHGKSKNCRAAGTNLQLTEGKQLKPSERQIKNKEQKGKLPKYTKSFSGLQKSINNIVSFLHLLIDQPKEPAVVYHQDNTIHTSLILNIPEVTINSFKPGVLGVGVLLAQPRQMVVLIPISVTSKLCTCLQTWSDTLALSRCSFKQGCIFYVLYFLLFCCSLNLNGCALFSMFCCYTVFLNRCPYINKFFSVSIFAGGKCGAIA